LQLQFAAVRRWRAIILVAAALVTGGIAVAVIVTRGGGEGGGTKAPSFERRDGFLSGDGGEGEVPATPGDSRRQGVDDLLSASYAARAYPRAAVRLEQARVARLSNQALPNRVPRAQAFAATSAPELQTSWRPIGPIDATALPYPWFLFKTRSDTVSGRVVALLIGRRCVPGDCRLWVGTAGGGIFRTDDALAPRVAWSPASEGLTSAAIGALALDPGDPSGRTLYAGTGERGSGGDSEAGLGVFRSTDGGTTWAVVPGSPAIAAGRAVSAIEVDPADPRKIYVATEDSVHGSSSVQGGETAPSGAPDTGLYESTDGGASFSLILAGQVGDIALDPNDSGTLYAAPLGRGLLRRSLKLDGDSAFHQVFQPPQAEAAERSRAEFALGDLGSRTRVYLGSAKVPAEAGDEVSNLYRADDASRPAADVLASWNRLSSEEPTSSGYGSYGYCQAQCWYSNFVASPPGRPDVVWLGGMFQYNEAADGESAGRTVMRSTDAGRTFNDLTADARTPAFAMHPDQHAIAFAPGDPDVAFVGNDGGLVRTSGHYATGAERCNRRLPRPMVARCRGWLARVPTRTTTLNRGLDTLQFQSASVNPAPGTNEILAGAQDNGTWSYSPKRGWRQIAGGDGGQSGVDVDNQQVRFHSYYGAAVRVSHSGGRPGRWRAIYVPLMASKEAVSFYMPVIADPRVGGTLFTGLEHVWRTKDDGGPRASIERDCDDDRSSSLPPSCGDWEPLGDELTGPAFGPDRSDCIRFRCFVVAVERAPSDTSTLWAATVPGRVFVSKNADADPGAVRFARIDLSGGAARSSTPARFVSGIAVDPRDPNHAWISYSGYDAYTPNDQPGHVFDVRFDPSTGAAVWTNRTYNLGDQPITDLVQDTRTGDLYAATDFGVERLPAGATAWTKAATDLPTVAVYGLTLPPGSSTLYAATHGRGVWSLRLRG
jgi:hypothetical protein